MRNTSATGRLAAGGITVAMSVSFSRAIKTDIPAGHLILPPPLSKDLYQQ
jgi:hypothetical protein